MQGEEIGATIGIGELDRDRHLAAERGIHGLELVHFHDLLIRDQLQEAAIVRIRLRSRLASLGRRIVRERDSESAALSGLEGVHLTSHAVGYFPFRYRVRVEKRTIDSRARRVDVVTDAGRTHNPRLCQHDGRFGSHSGPGVGCRKFRQIGAETRRNRPFGVLELDLSGFPTYQELRQVLSANRGGGMLCFPIVRKLLVGD